MAACLIFALLGLVSLAVSDQVDQWLCAHVIQCARHGDCPIDICIGDWKLNMLRTAIWIGPPVIFGASGFVFGGRQRSMGAWLLLLTTLVISHALIMIIA